MRDQPQTIPPHDSEGFSPARRRPQQHRGVRIRHAPLRQRGHDQRRSHALAHQHEFRARMATADQRLRHGEIVDHGLDASPAPCRRRGAKAALIVGVGGDAFLAPDQRRFFESLGIVAETMQPQNDDLGFAFGNPAPQRQAIGIGGNQRITLQRCSNSRRPCRLHHRRASDQQSQHERRDEWLHLPCVRATKASSRSLSSVVRSAISRPAACAAAMICSTLVALGR